MNNCSPKSDTFLMLLFVGVVLLIYFPVLENDFILLWDDKWQVMTETTENGFTWNNIGEMFLSPFHNQYFPVNQFFYLFVYTLGGGYNAFAFHLFCVVLHLLNTLLIYQFFKQLLRQSRRIEDSWIVPVSFITAFLFAIHPLNVESVAWISASKILLYAFFYLLSLYSYLIYTEKRKIGYFIVSMFMLLCSFGSKEQAVILPLCLLMIDWMLGRNLKSPSVWIEKVPFFLLAFCMGCATMYFAHGKITFSEGDYALWQRIIFACYSYVEYLVKWILPVNLLYLYPFPSLPNEPIPDWMMVYPLLIVLVVYLLRKILVLWPVALGFLFFTINLIMTLHIIPMPRFAIVADRYIYLSSAGLAFILGYYLVAVYKQRQQYRIRFVVVFICYSLYIGIYANMRTHVWFDSETLKQEVRELIYQRNDYYTKE